MKKHFFLSLMFLIFCICFTSCGFISSFKENGGDNIDITYLGLSKPTLNMQVGGMDYISVTIKPQEQQKNVKLHWEYDNTIIDCDTSSCWGISITGLKEGKTQLKCSYNGYDAVCIITVSGYAQGYEEQVEPYIYSNTTILTTSPGVSERVYVSLYGGTAADIEGYSWTIDNPSVATINPTGQYCLITAKDSGYTRIKVTHNKSLYPYYIGVYVFADATNIPYITTPNNVLTMNVDSSSQTITCNLVNGKEGSLDSQFTWQIINSENGITPVRMESINNQAVITPLTNGSCTIRITHPDSIYPMDILCRVISIVKNVYIQPDSTITTIEGQGSAIITSELIGVKEGEYNIDDYSYRLDRDDVAQIYSSVGNQVVLKGLKNGSCKLIISHPKAAYSRECLIIVNGQLSNAIDASCYITTDQNYIKTKIGADPVKLKISLKGGSTSDVNNFTWDVVSTADDGSTNNVIELSTTNGTAIHSSSRAAVSSYCDGIAYIHPKKEGTAVITLTNPIVAYPTEVLVKVYNENAILEEPLYFGGNGIISILNGQTYNYSAELNGENKKASDDSLITWSSDNSSLQINANGNSAIITAPPYGSGKKTTWLTLTHPKADVPKKVLVLTADTQEELASFNVLYSDKLYYNLEVNDEADICLNYYGFDTYDENGNIVSLYNFSGMNWTVDNPEIVYIERYTNNPLLCKIKGLKAGTTKVRVSVEDSTCIFTVTIYPKGAINISPAVYFTTAQNVVSIDTKGKTQNVNISAVNLSGNEYSNITWTVNDSSVATVYANGTSAQIKGLKEGETFITVSHPKSENTLKIYVRIGSEYIFQAASPVVYISSQDVMTFLKDDPAASLKAMLMNYNGQDTSGFTFSIDKTNIATISAQSTNGTCYIKPVSSGQAEVTISHPQSEIDKKVLIVVGNSAEELAGIKYLTTSSNVVAVGEGNRKNVSVSVQNAESVVIDGYTWTSSNPSIVDVTYSGATAVLTGNSIGTAMITVTNSQCQYGLTIIAQCVDPIAAAANPYIQLTSSVQLLTVSNQYYSITAELIGGTDEDNRDFDWRSNDPSVCTVYGQNGVGKVKALKAGTTYITVSHPKANYTAQVLVVCDNPVVSDCSISVSSSIIQMKPTDSSQTITATLVNGTAADKYNFRWSLDVYDVIDFIYSGNQCTITPKQTGTATITISHPKSPYDQQIIVTVDEFTTFAFPSESFTTTKGEVNFLSMQVPHTKQSSHIVYKVDDSSKCSLVGTKSIAQLSAIGAGTTIVRAQLVATSTGTILANAEMMVYIKEAPVNVNYISSASTIYTVNKGKSQTLTAMITGNDIVSTDQYNFQWTSNDSDIIKVTGLNSQGYVTGQSIYITAVNPGEAIITCSHPKAQSSLQFYVVVPGAEAKTVTLNKTYLTLTKGSSGTTLTANIENSTSSDDYNMENLEWKAELKNGVEIARVMGNGKTVTVYPVSVGETTVSAQLKNGSIAKCTVKVEAGKSITFEDTSKVVQPFHTKKIKYIISPPDAYRTWTVNQQDDYFEYNDLGCNADGIGYVEVTGIKEGSGTLYCIAENNIKGQINIKCSWDYSFNVNTSVISGIPGQEAIIEYYNLNPSDAVITVESTQSNLFDYTVQETGEGKGEIKIMPLQEIHNQIDIILTAKNPNDNNAVVGTKIIKAKFDYANLNVKVSFVNSDGNFSRYDSDSNILTIGDGENVQLKFEIEEAMANGSIKSITWQPSNSNDSCISLGEITSSDTYEIKQISHNEDYMEYQYRILSAVKPVYRPSYTDSNGNVSYGSPITIDDWKNEFYIQTYTDGSNMINFEEDANVIVKSRRYSTSSNWLNDTNYYEAYAHNKKATKDFYGSQWSTVNNPDEVGKVYLEADFKKILWYYRPYTTAHIQEVTAVMQEKIWNCEALKESITDKKIINNQMIGKIIVIINHNGAEQNKIEIPVYLEKRACSKETK